MGVCYVCVVVCTAIWLSVDFTSAQATQECTWEDTADMAGAQWERALATITAGLVACQQECEKDARCTAINYFTNLRCDIFYEVPQLFSGTDVIYSLRKCRALTVTTQAPAGTTSLPESGPVCALDGQGCLSSATCNTELNRCECPQGTHGDGALECAPMDNLLCTIARDPQVNTWDNSRTSIDLPCWYYVTDFTSGQCGIVVKALHELENDGMLFVSAVLVEFSAVRKDASANVTSPGPVTFKISRSIIEQAGGRNPWSGSQTDIIEGVEIRKLWDAGNRFAILDFPSCGAQVKFRPHVPGQNLQVLPPGLTISAPKTAEFGAQNTRYICQVPGSGAVYRTLRKKNNFSHQDLVPIHLILSTHRQIQDGGSCSALEATMTNCASRLQPFATEYCGPILTDRSIRKCILKKNYDPVEYFRSCLQWVCTGEENACKHFSTYDSCDGPPPHIVPVQCGDSKPNEEPTNIGRTLLITL